MFKRLRNKSGTIPFPIVFAGINGVMGGAYLGCVGVLVLTSVILTPAHRLNKAVTKCVNLGEGTAEVCATRASGMTSAERREYIRDTQESPSSIWDR